MTRVRRAISGILILVAAAACTQPAPPATTALNDPAPIEAVSLAWKEAYNAGDVAKVTALYAEDAVLSAPGKPAVLGNAAIGEYFVKTIAEFASLGFVVSDQPMGKVETSGDLAWQWQTYKVADKSGQVVDAGKLVTLFKRVDGQWKIAGDTWSSDGTVAPPQPTSP